MSWRWMGRSVGVTRVRPVLLAIAAAFLLSGTGLVLLVSSPGLPSWAPGHRGTLSTVRVAGDGDSDGLPDALENVIGSDPERFGTLGTIPDGWLYHWYGTSIDWEDRSLLASAALAPPAGAIPAPLASTILLPNVTEVFTSGAEAAREAGFDGAWWLEVTGLDPRNWDNNGDELADAWLLQYGLDPLTVDPTAKAAGDTSMTVQQKYDQGLAPTRPDTDGDGLTDLQELQGSARMADQPFSFAPTDPRRFSTANNSVADGYVVRVGLDPHKAGIADLAPVVGGLTVFEGFRITQAACREAAKGECDWGKRLEEGPFVNPSIADSLQDGSPDAWEYREPGGLLHPLKDSRKVVLDSSEEWDGHEWSGAADLKGLVVDDLNPKPAHPAVVTAVDAYRFRRPLAWDEETQGPWWNGLPPSIDTLPGALPASVALRGWNLTIDGGLGNETRPIGLQATADPRKSDTDSDGLTDVQEYFGTNGWRTDPNDADTDRDGLGDAQETTYGTNPLRRDTPGGFLEDGEREAYWLEQASAARDLRSADPGRFALVYGDLPNGDPDVLLPTGVLRGALSNMLVDDADGDGLKDGEELFPMRFPVVQSHPPRNPTLPWSIDTDQDGLPDWWEIRWSKSGHYCEKAIGCNFQMSVSGWPLDPTLRRSLDLAQWASDADANLAGDTISLPQGESLAFSNSLAFQFDLDPYSKDEDGDGLTNLFELHWGVLNVAPEAVERMQADAANYRWAFDAEAALSKVSLERMNVSVPGPVALNPLATSGGIDSSTNLRGAFGLREKGTWILAPGPCQELSKTALPAGTSRAETEPRLGLRACWTWYDQPLAADQANGRNPWLLDSDGDGIDDAWLEAYGLGTVSPAAILPSSEAAGCKEESRGGKKDGSLCTTYQQAFDNGLDPNAGDSDHGSFPDWQELALGRDPLDSGDDFALSDWDLDGIPNLEEALGGTNLLNPDSDHDGLADGADVCIDPQGTTILPQMEGRTDGIDTGRELARVYDEAGVLRDASANNGCPGGRILYLGEGRLDLDDGEIHGAGHGTDSRKQDTAGNGVPDGWLVYWRNAATSSDAKAALEPAVRIPDDQRDVDLDLVDLATEYLAGRPSDWDEERDGVWWGGSDPTRPDTDGDRGWFKTALDGDDASDADLDNDGLTSGDPDTFADAAGNLVIWDAEASPPRYRTNMSRVEQALLQRTAGTVRDGDPVPDTVPDFIDRARTRIELDPLAEASLEKGRERTLSGRVLTSEAPLAGADYRVVPSGPTAVGEASVGGATVLAWLSAGGERTLAGIGFTDKEGRFTIQLVTEDSVFSPPAPVEGAVVAGHVLAGGESVALPSLARLLDPGLAQVTVTVEPTAAALQSLTFTADDGVPRASARAFKDMVAGGYSPPGSPPLRAITLQGGQPLVDGKSVQHSAEAIFASESDSLGILLQGRAVLEPDEAPEVILTGQPVTAKGRLLDSFQTPLAGRTVRIELRTANGVRSAEATTAADGSYLATIPTHGLPAGAAVLNLTSVLPEQAGTLSPKGLDLPRQLRTSSQWLGVRAAHRGLPNGGLVEFDATLQVTLSGALVDHRGEPLVGRPVKVTLKSGSTLITERHETTAAGGLVTVRVTLPPGTPASILDVAFAAGPAPFEDRQPFAAFLLPRYPSILSLADVVLSAGQPGNATGTLTRHDGTPISSASALINVVDSRGLSLEVRGTDALGQFRIPLPAGGRGLTILTASFAGGGTLRPSGAAHAEVHRLVDSSLILESPPTLVDDEFVARGKVLTADGVPANGSVQVYWEDGRGVFTPLDPDGRFEAILPPQAKPGPFTWNALFLGDLDVRQSHASSVVAVLLNTTMSMAAPGTTFDAAGATASPVINGTLVDSRGVPLVGRVIQVRLSYPDEPTDALTDSLRLQATAGKPFGSWVTGGDPDALEGLRALPLGAFVRGVDLDRDGKSDADGGMYLSRGLTVQGGDVRLYAPGQSADVVIDWEADEVGRPLATEVVALRYVDLDGNGRFRAGEPVYADTDASQSVTAGDIRLTAAARQPAFSRVVRTHSDVGTGLDEPLPGMPVFLPQYGRSRFSPWDPIYWMVAQAQTGPGRTAEVLTDANGQFEVQTLAELGATKPGNATATVTYAGAPFEVGSMATMAVDVRHEIGIVVHQAPDAVDRGSAFVLAGDLRSGAISNKPMVLRAFAQGEEVASTMAKIGNPWRMEVQLPARFNSTAWTAAALDLALDATPGYNSSSVPVEIALLDPLEVRLHAAERTDGGRDVTVEIVGLQPSDIPDGLLVRLVLSDADGSFLEAIPVKTTDGKATISLAADQEGRLSAAVLRDPRLYVVETSASATPLPHTVNEPALPYLWLGVAIATLLVGASALAVWITWQVRHRRSLRDAVRAEHALLLDGRIPAVQAIRRIHKHLLAMLAKAGYEAGGQETARDIAERATASFRLPVAAMRRLTTLFEGAAYSGRAMGAIDRREALAALAELGSALGARIPLPPVPQAPVRRSVR